MPKRKGEHIAEEIRRLQKRLRRYYSSDSSDDEDRHKNDHEAKSDSDVPILPISESDDSESDSSRPQSAVTAHNDMPSTSALPTDSLPPPTATPSTNTLPALPEDILEALGDPKTKDEEFGPPIPEEIAKRWGRVLVEGLTKDQKQKIEENTLIPQNFQLAKAPLLNPEITHVLSDAARNRDKLLAKSQNQLGRGIAELTNLAATIISEDLNKIEMLKRISNISQIFLDLHHEDTKRRRKLVTASLDKKFLYMITDVKRDEFLFGNNLGEKIKASKTAERSGLQLKRNYTTSTSKKPYHQGNWRGPPRGQGQRTSRQGGPRGRYSSQQTRRQPAPADRTPRTTKTSNKKY